MLDVHIADTFEAATQNQSECSFDSDVHELIFSRSNVPIDQFPLLLRMRDYYADASFLTPELPSVVRELQRLVGLLPARNQLVSTLEQFQIACEKAMTSEKNLYLICD